MMARENWTKMERIASLIGMIGNVDSYKKLKSLIYISSTDNKRYFNYKWDQRFFGPQSSDFLRILESAVNKAYVDEFFQKPEKEDHPIHHGYKPTAVSYSITKQHIDQKLDEFKKKGIAEPTNFLYWMVALRNLPTAVVLNEALRISDERKQLRRYPSADDLAEPSCYLKLNYTVHFDDENISKLKEFYEDKGIFFKHIDAKKEQYEIDKVEVDIDKIDESINKRYEYLRLDKRTNEKIKWNEIVEKLDKIGLNLNENKLLKYAEEYLSQIENPSYIEKSNERLDYVLGGLKQVMKNSNGKKFGLRTKFYFSSAFEISVHPDLKKSLEKWSDSYLFDLYHLFQPFERVAYLTKLI
jgi:hypothetical protein